jgi:hypothetical protein
MTQAAYSLHNFCISAVGVLGYFHSSCVRNKFNKDKETVCLLPISGRYETIEHLKVFGMNLTTESS